MSRTEWTQEKIAILGTKTDAEIAKTLGTSLDTVRAARRGLGIRPSNQQRKWSASEIALLGTMSDSDVAKKTGRNAAAVAAARKRHKIPGVKGRRPRIRWTEDAIQLLGSVPDKQIAEMLGCSAQSVLNKRLELGISSKRGRRKKKQNNNWARLQALPQHEFFNEIRRILSEHWGRKVVYPDLASITLYSLSRIQKWATPGSAQEPLAITVRHHIWAAAMLALHRVIKKPRTVKAPH